MQVEISILDYEPQRTLKLLWEKGYFLSTETVDGKSIRIIGNQGGLISLARHLLTLAQSSVPTGSHIHLDEWNSLEKDSVELIIERM